MNTSDFYMQRCLDLAKPGPRLTAPNPSVGAVLVYNNQIIGEGCTSPFGGAHAEVNAINSVVDNNLISKATLYVSLEPCCHVGKTPPCTNLIIDSGIKHVVIGTRDNFDKVDGKGITLLKAAGIKVELGVLQRECKELNKRFFTFHEKKRPFVILKWAQSKDGFIDRIRTADEQSTKITSPQSNILVHKWRSEEQVILVGSNTVIMDNPKLTVRHVAGINPTRIVLDRYDMVGENAAIFGNEAPTVVYTTSSQSNIKNRVKIDDKADFLEKVLTDLYSKGFLSVLIEGGATIHQAFIDSGIWDEARVFIGKDNINTGISAPKLNRQPVQKESIATDQLLIYRNA